MTGVTIATPLLVALDGSSTLLRIAPCTSQDVLTPEDLESFLKMLTFGAVTTESGSKFDIGLGAQRGEPPVEASHSHTVKLRIKGLDHEYLMSQVEKTILKARRVSSFQGR